MDSVWLMLGNFSTVIHVATPVEEAAEELSGLITEATDVAMKPEVSNA